jgi:hypothetical protein
MQEAWHRRHAIQIVAALPEDTDDALIVLGLAKELVEGFLGGRQRAEPPAFERERGSVVLLSSATKGASS